MCFSIKKDVKVGFQYNRFIISYFEGEKHYSKVLIGMFGHAPSHATLIAKYSPHREHDFDIRNQISLHTCP